jgi:hypothetical protein
MKLLIVQFPPSAVTSFHLGINIFLNTMFSNTLNPYFPFHMRNQLSRPYKTMGQITANYFSA